MTAVTVRPARRDDLAQVATISVQLYNAELPDALTGTLAKRQSLLHFTLEANTEQALRHRYVVCLNTNEVGATGMMQLPTEPDFERAPAGTLQQARALLGYHGAAQLLFTVARSTVGLYRQNNPTAVLFHSVVVSEQHRRRGLGRLLMRELERTATEHGYRWGVLQVLGDNELARRLYVQLGYQDIWHTPRWVGAFTWRSYVMQKALAARDA